MITPLVATRFVTTARFVTNEIVTNRAGVHDEQRSIQMTILHRYINIQENTAQTSTLIINNGSKNSKRRPESHTINEKRQQ